MTLPTEITQCILCSSFWAALLQIIVIDVVLSIDNAIIISLASYHLPKHIRKYVAGFGVFLAIILRIILTLFTTYLLSKPYLKAVGGLILFVIAFQLLQPKKDTHALSEKHSKTQPTILNSLIMIILSDVIMSLDNVLAIAGIANNHLVLLILGLIFSIPLIMVSSNLLIGLMKRYPLIIDIGSAILAYTATKMIITDTSLVIHLQPSKSSTILIPFLSFCITIALGYIGRILHALKK